MKLLSVAESCGEPPTCSRRDPEFSVGLSELCDLFSESFDLESNDLNNSESSTSRRQRKACRKLERYKRTVEKRRLNRVNERKRRRARAAEIANRRVYLETALDVCIDFEFTNKMSDKEIAKLARQMARVWVLQKRYVGLQVTLLSPCKRFLEEGRRAVTGFDSFRWKILHSRSYLENQEKRIVYMSPDASLPPLLDVLHDTIYVVGGLVDETGVGSLSRKRADGLHIDTYRLPIREYMQKGSKGTFNLMLTINQVVEILVRFFNSRNWSDVLATVVPPRIGYKPACL